MTMERRLDHATPAAYLEDVLRDACGLARAAVDGRSELEADRAARFVLSAFVVGS